MAVNYAGKPWTGREIGKDVPWGHHTIRLDGKDVRISRAITMPLDTCHPEGDGYVGLDEDDLIRALPDLFRGLRAHGWTVEPPQTSHVDRAAHHDSE